MLSEILKIKPQLDSSDLRKMENTLNQRFKRIAKRFGAGLNNIIKGGGIAGIALGFINKFLNPLKETQDAIDKMLNKSDDISTNASQFNTTAGKLFKLVQLAKSTGLDQDNLFTLISKFQTSVAEAKADPSNPANAAVLNYTGQEDSAEGFFAFIQQLQKMDKNNQILVQKAVFGEKQVLKMAEFMQTNMGDRLKATGLDKVTSEKFSKSIEKMADLQNLQDLMTVRRESEDVLNKSRIINSGMIKAQDTAERISLARENERIKSYENLRALSETSEKIFALVEKGVSQLGSFITFLTPTLNRLVTSVEKLMQSRWIRGMLGTKDK